MTGSAWRHPIRLADIPRGGLDLQLSPAAEARAAVAAALDLVALEAFKAHVTLRPWLDGAIIKADWTATVVQTCGVSLESFPQALADTFEVRVLPAGSPNMAEPPSEVSLDVEAADPPDAVEGGGFDLAAYLVEALSLSIDPWPRKPDAVFDAEAYATRETSPFSVLATLKPKA